MIKKAYFCEHCREPLGDEVYELLLHDDIPPASTVTKIICGTCARLARWMLARAADGYETEIEQLYP